MVTTSELQLHAKRFVWTNVAVDIGQFNASILTHVHACINSNCIHVRGPARKREPFDSFIGVLNVQFVVCNILSLITWFYNKDLTQLYKCDASKAARTDNDVNA